MPKGITCVYQDCIMCGDRGKKIQKIIAESEIDLVIKKVSFAAPEGKELIHKALSEYKIGTMPFFTDGEKFSTKLEDFTEKCEEKPEKTRKNVKKTTKKRTYKKKGGTNESN